MQPFTGFVGDCPLCGRTTQLRNVIGEPNGLIVAHKEQRIRPDRRASKVARPIAYTADVQCAGYGEPPEPGTVRLKTSGKEQAA